MIKQPYCKNCGHPAHREDCGVDDCGCIRYEARANRANRQRTWLVRIAFFVFNKWTPEKEIRVKAQGIGGASMKGIRQAKHERESTKRILQTRITVVPVPNSGG